MELPILAPIRFMPTIDILAILNGRRWCCSYSGGKDSTTLVTWIEWLRRTGFVRIEQPALVLSDTRVEYPFLRGIADAVMEILTASGWRCEIVTPPVNQRLYCRIFGVGNTPIHPGGRRMRWCTRATKIDPMKAFARTLGEDVLQLSGVRYGESEIRDAKLHKSSCAAGGECGLPDPGEGVCGPLLSWKLCKVLEWLGGKAGVSDVIGDLLPHMARLLEVYDVKATGDDLFGQPPVTTHMRFGCIGCPAISNEKVTKSSEGRKHPLFVHLRRIYGIWQALYLAENRCCRVQGHPKFSARKVGNQIGVGPLRMEVRKRYFAEFLAIQADAGVVLVTPEDEAFIRDCWARKVYPRGWSQEDELVRLPASPVQINSDGSRQEWLPEILKE